MHARQGVTTSPAETSSPQAPVTLKEAAHGKFKVGVGVSARIATSEQDWPLLTSQFSIITPENCMKPQAIQPNEGDFHFQDADVFMKFAVQQKLQVVGHCLVWAKDDRTPSWWLKDGEIDVSKAVLLLRMKKHIDTVTQRYGDKISMWDVVNEALSDGGEGYLRDSVWSRTANEEFIVEAFQYARENCPDALLIYNDYQCDLPSKRAKLVRLLKSLKAQGAPVDAMGLQGHCELDSVPFKDLEATFAAMREIGMKVVISELDIDVVKRNKWWSEGGKYRAELASFDPYKDGCPPEILQRQADQYAELFRIFAANCDVIARVSFWNLHDGQSWLNYFPWQRTNHPLLFDRQGVSKPAYDAVIKAMQPNIKE